MSALQLIGRMIPTSSFVGMGVILCILKVWHLRLVMSFSLV